MAAPLRTAELSSQDTRKRPAGAALAALGVVYGDIGTSALYGLKQAVVAGGAPARDTVMGIVSVILWSLFLIVALKYAILILRADNRGEGGIVALLALLDVRHAPRGSWRASLLIVGLIGAALLYGDGVITPAISVLSAVEGLKIDAPRLAPMVVPVTIAILVGLFLVQRKGTDFIGNIFGPVMLVWFVAIGLLGLVGIMRTPGILSAISPHHAVVYLVQAGPTTGFAVLGAAFLALTGAEAMYADMGHFGRLPVQLGWFMVVLPALMLNYLGQGDCFWRTRTRSRIHSTCSHFGRRIIPWWRSRPWPPSSPRNPSSPARTPSPSKRSSSASCRACAWGKSTCRS
jgi:KUP system potassium uptake protein